MTSDDTDNPTDASNSASVTDSESGPECGDGEVNGDEVCDDGVNDGSYGGCLEDCSGPAAFCGDGDVNGPEECDDGVNDGSYDGCEADCGALGPYCGDGAVNGDEGCDNGDDNKNASGCNVNCLVSGSELARWELESALTPCKGEYVTTPAVRDNGNVLVAFSSYCGDLLLLELDENLELVEDYADSVLLPTVPVFNGTLLGDDWLLSAYECNYLISDMGDLTEVCEAGRVAGQSALWANADDTYVALNYDELAKFAAGSPAMGDSPAWSVTPPDNVTYDYNFAAATAGSAGSTFISGYRRQISSSTYVGYIWQYTSAGNSAGIGIDSDYRYFYDIVDTPDGGVLIHAYDGSGFEVVKYNGNFNKVWNHPIPNAGNFRAIEVDSNGDILLVYDDGPTRLRKLEEDGSTEKWTTDVDESYNGGISVDSDDNIYRAGSLYNPETFLVDIFVAKYAP
jgi:hypothetical protein